MQRDIVESALRFFVSATQPRSQQVDVHEWGTHEWRQRYMEIKPEDYQRLRRAGEERRLERQRFRDTGSVRKD